MAPPNAALVAQLSLVGGSEYDPNTSNDQLADQLTKIHDALNGPQKDLLQPILKYFENRRWHQWFKGSTSDEYSGPDTARPVLVRIPSKNYAGKNAFRVCQFYNNKWYVLGFGYGEMDMKDTEYVEWSEVPP